MLRRASYIAWHSVPWVLLGMNLVWTKLVVILACTMADERDAVGGFNSELGLLRGWGLSALNLSLGTANASSHPRAPPPAVDDNVCPSSCRAVEQRISVLHAVAPTPIAAVVWLVASLPTFVVRSRRKTLGIRACLWQLLALWLNLVIAHLLFSRQRVWGYAWAIHSAVHTLTAWAPSRRVLVTHSCHRVLTVFGILAVCIYAWQVGPQVGIISWRGGWVSQCGLSAHLLAVLGVDLVGWVLGPIGRAVAGTGEVWD